MSERIVGFTKRVWQRIFRPSRNSLSIFPTGAIAITTSILVLVGIFALMIVGDDDAIRWIRTAPHPVVQSFQYVTELGRSSWILVGSFVLAVPLILADWNQMPARRRVRMANRHADLTFIFVTVAITGTLASLVKNTIGRARPKHFDTLGHLEFDFAAFTSTFASFPSGHSTTFGAFCMGLTLLWPRFWPVWLGAALLGGVSRAFVGAHYPSDILAGLLFGAVGTVMIARFLARRGLMFKPTSGFLVKRKRPGLK